MIRKLFSLFNKKVALEFTDTDGVAHELKIPKQVSVLDTLLNNGVDIPYSCKAGLCKSCVMKCSTPASLPEESIKGLSPAEIELGYFLPCSCLPESKLSISSIAGSSHSFSANVIEKNLVADNIIQLKLSAPFRFKGGQFCNLFKSENLCRSYSIASEDNAPYLEFHIKHIENGQFSSWAANELALGDEITIQGPFGECIYLDLPANKSQALLMCGIGTGLAPLLGVIRTALSSAHTGPITLIVGAKNANSFYLTEEIQELERMHTNLNVHWLATEQGEAPLKDLELADIYQYVKENFPDLGQHQVYLCGAPSFVQKMKKQSFLSGASMNAIFSDIFQPAS